MPTSFTFKCMLSLIMKVSDYLMDLSKLSQPTNLSASSPGLPDLVHHHKPCAPKGGGQGHALRKQLV